MYYVSICILQYELIIEQVLWFMFISIIIRFNYCFLGSKHTSLDVMTSSHLLLRAALSYWLYLSLLSLKIRVNAPFWSLMTNRTKLDSFNAKVNICSEFNNSETCCAEKLLVRITTYFAVVNRAGKLCNCSSFVPKNINFFPSKNV